MMSAYCVILSAPVTLMVPKVLVALIVIPLLLITWHMTKESAETFLATYRQYLSLALSSTARIIAVPFGRMLAPPPFATVNPRPRIPRFATLCRLPVGSFIRMLFPLASESIGSDFIKSGNVIGALMPPPPFRGLRRYYHPVFEIFRDRVVIPYRHSFCVVSRKAMNYVGTCREHFQHAVHPL